MGAENYLMRNRGPWSLQEALTMFNLVCKATQAKILRSSMTVNFINKANSSKRFEVEGHNIKIYDSSRVQVDEIIPIIIKPKRAKKYLKSFDLVVSWKTISEKL